MLQTSLTLMCLIGPRHFEPTMLSQNLPPKCYPNKNAYATLANKPTYRTTFFDRSDSFRPYSIWVT